MGEAVVTAKAKPPVRPNIRRLRSIVRWLRSTHAEQEHRGLVFDMTTFGKHVENGFCGTAACIGGSALIFFGASAGITCKWSRDPEYIYASFHKNGREVGSVGYAAREVLGLTPAVADALFCPEVTLPDITPSHAARTIEHLIETGEVNWRRTARGSEKKDAMSDAKIVANWGRDDA